MRRKILMGMLIFVFFAIVAVAKADPSVVIELGIDVVPPGEITLEVCETIELKWVIENFLHPEVHYVTLTAAIQNNTLLEIITAPHYNATYEVYDPDGSLLSSGTVGGVLTMEQFAYWDSMGLKLFEMVTWRLPDSVVLPGDGGYINFSFPVHCEGVGTTRIVLFPRATEDHEEPITDPTNLWQEEGRWYPLHNSYDPWDPDINSGHSFNFNWWRHTTTTAFARASYTVIQVPPAPRPSIDVEKTGPDFAHEGDEITYEIIVNNTGNRDLYNVNVHDTLLGDLTGYLPDNTLEVDEVNTFNVADTVPTPQVPDVENNVTASGEDELGTPVSDSALWTVDILHPNIVVDKSGPDHAHEGDTITYTINVTNTGDCELTVTVSDPLLGGDLWSGTLAPGTSHTFTVDYTVPTPSDDVTNTVTATGEDAIGGLKGTVTATDEHFVDILHPDIVVEKTGPNYAHEGDTITYTINVTNTGDCELTVTVSDPTLGGDLWTGTIAAGDSHIFTVDYTIPTPSEDITNTVTATGVDTLGGLKGTVTATDDHFVDVLHPSIDVIKTANATEIHYCDWVEYNVTVVNTGDCSLSVVLTDTMISIDWSGTLAPGDKHEEIVVFHPEEDPTKNTASAVGTDQLGGTVEDSDSWLVGILHPGIDVEKTGPTSAHEGDTITYTITVNNTGNCPLYNVTVTDTLLGDLTGYLPDNTLEVDEVNTFNVADTVPTPQVPDVENTVTASGEDELGKLVSDSASWTVDILHPSIAVEKTGSDFAHEGDLITYTINVINTGDCELSVTVSDPMLTGDLWTGTLASGTSYTFSVDYNVPSPSDDITNTVTATGVDAIGGLKGTVTATDDHSVDILHPNITVDKMGPEYAHEGDLITYTINVTNTGDCDLYNVNVTDTLLGQIYSDGLAFDETKTFTVNYTVPAGVDPLVNTVTAEGEDELGLTVTDSDSWSVGIVRHPDIDIDKKAIPSIIEYGGWVTYKYNVTNTGDCVLYNVEITDDKLGFIEWIWMLDVGQTVTVDVSVQLFETTKNNGTATGEDQFGQQVSDSDDAFVYVRAVYCAHTIGYWKNHPWAWEGISPWEEFPWTTGRVEHYTYMHILWTPSEGDASIQLAHQYIAAVLNQHAYGVPQYISETITAAEAFFEDYPAGSNPEGEARTQALELASILEDYNSGGISPISGGGDVYATHTIWTLGLVTSSIIIAATGIRKRPRRASRSKLARKRTVASS